MQARYVPDRPLLHNTTEWRVAAGLRGLQGENDEAVDALFGYAGASCAYIQSQGVCEYPSEWGWDIFKKLCPVSCQNSGLDFCPGGDEDGWLLTYAYFLYGSPEEGTDAYDWVMGMYGNGCAKSPEIMAEGTPDQTMVCCQPAVAAAATRRA